MTTKKHNRYIFFWKVNEPNGIYSQWYPSKFIEDDVEFNTAEQYMMYYKAMLFDDTDIAKKILETNSPKDIKALGRKVKNFDEKEWDATKEAIVLRGNILKFEQNLDLKEELLSHPSNTVFVEASPLDKIWGIGFTAQNALKNKTKWGSNLLGKVISQVRQLLETESESE